MTTKEMIAIQHLRRVSPVNPWSIKAHKIANGGTVKDKRQLLFELYDEGRDHDVLMGNIIGRQAWTAVNGKEQGQVSGFVTCSVGPVTVGGIFASWQPDATPVTSADDLLAAKMQGGLSDAELFAKFQQGEVIDSTKSYGDHQAEIDLAPPARPAAPANDQTGGAAA